MPDRPASVRRRNQGAVLARVLGGEVVPPSRYASNLPPQLDAVVLRGLQRNPEKRFATARQMAPAPYTPGSGWTALGTTGTTKTHYVADYLLGAGPTVASETETSTLSTTWSAVIATFQ